MKKRVNNIQDTFEDGGSILDNYWNDNEPANYFKKFRQGGNIPIDFEKNTTSVDRVSEIFKLKGIQFGNWLTLEDKYNYLSALYISLHDLNSILKFPVKNLGIGQSLGIAFGARGRSRALAHFESSSEAINLTRYKRNDVLMREMEDLGQLPFPTSKEHRFIHTGGVGSFAHEYGHFLDYSIGRYVEPHPDTNWLSGTYRSIDVKRIKYSAKYPLHILMEDIIQTAMRKKDGEPTEFANRLKKLPDYWRRRLEIFARIFEHYIQHKMVKTTTIKNLFLSKTKYTTRVYLQPKEMLVVEPKIDRLIELIRKKMK